jgi:PAS domain-containing protein
LQSELTAHTAARDRFIESQLFGYAIVTPAGELVRCNEAFARMFGFENATDAVAASAGAPLPELVDHAHLMHQLHAGATIGRVESVVRRTNGQPFRVLTSATLRPVDAHDQDGPALVERMFIDLDDRTRLEERLRLARRLETAGRLTAEMSNAIEPLLPSITDPAADVDDRERVSALVGQLLAFGQRQAKPAGLLLLHEAIRRAESRLRQLVGDDVTFDTYVEDVGVVAAGEDDIEAVLLALVFTARGCLPYGGTILMRTHATRSGFTEQTELAVSAAGYGVQPALISSSLERLVSRCGGTVHVGDEPARTTTLHVLLPR